MWRIKSILNCCTASLYYFRDCIFNYRVLFLTEAFLGNYGDNNLFSIGREQEFVKAILINFKAETDSFYQNPTVLNRKKYHYMCIGKIDIKVEDLCLTNSKEEELFGITTDSKFNYNSHRKMLYSNVCQKVNAFSKMAEHLDKDKIRPLFNGNIGSQFS